LGTHKAYKEWYLQADYDFDTAEAMYKSGRYLYTVFMCHLCIEKALKGLMTKSLKITPPKVHNLVYLVDKIDLTLSEEHKNFVLYLNHTSLPTRYPEDLNRMMKLYNKEKAKDYLKDTKDFLQWIKEQ